MSILIALLGIAVLLVFSTLWKAFVVTKLWTWFIVPTFGLPALSIPVAIGVAMVVTFLTYQWRFEEIPEDRKVEYWAQACMVSTLMPAFFLLFGWIVTLFM